MMQSITFECEVITPMFLAGADGATPELRAPSIKGALRFWWRALNGHLPLEELREKEMKIFGGVIGDKALKSSLHIRIPTQPMSHVISNEVWKEANYEMRTSKNTGKHYFASRRNGRSLEGLGYLFYSTWLDGENPRKAIMPNPNAPVTFQVTFRFLESDHVDGILKALKCLVIFGGLGTRTRRGAGSFKVCEILKCSDDELRNQFEETLLRDTFSSVEDLKDIIEEIKVEEHTNHSFSHLSKGKVFLFESEGRWQDALERIGKPFKEFRDLEKGNISETPNFGFPIVHKSSRTTMQAGKKNDKKVTDKLERRSSPLIFKVVEGDYNRYYPLIIWLSGELLPDRYKIMDKSGKNESETSTDIIENFIDSLEFEEEIKL